MNNDNQEKDKIPILNLSQRLTLGYHHYRFLQYYWAGFLPDLKLSKQKNITD